MQNHPSRVPIHFDNPAVFQITVQGQVDTSWSPRLEDMRISQKKTEKGYIITILEGELSDQAALAGVLNTLYELHLTLLSVSCLDL
jgi:hypothetical protein